MRLGETPVPIPNTMVKTQEADGTMLETAWESRWLPDQKKLNLKRIYQRSEYKTRFCIRMTDNISQTCTLKTAYKHNC